MLKFRANASCALKQEDKWASFGRESNGDMGNAREKGGPVRLSQVTRVEVKRKGTATWEGITLLSHSPMLPRPKLAHFKSSCFSAQEALARNVNIII